MSTLRGADCRNERVHCCTIMARAGLDLTKVVVRSSLSLIALVGGGEEESRWVGGESR